jgi:hypothetical protein
MKSYFENIQEEIKIISDREKDCSRCMTRLKQETDQKIVLLSMENILNNINIDKDGQIKSLNEEFFITGAKSDNGVNLF